MEERYRSGASAAAGSRSRRSNQHTGVPQLSCELCRERKVKCDKLNPCTNCASAGVVCTPVYRHRLPRGRHVQPSATVGEDLKTRIRRLEALINDVAPSESRPGPIPLTAQEHITQNGAHSHIASPSPNTSTIDEQLKQASLIQNPQHFWADLAEEIHGLHDIIESSLDEAEDETVQQPEAEGTNFEHHNLNFLGLSTPNEHESVYRCLDPDSQSRIQDSLLARQLCKVYLQQVDPIMKILHRPSLEKAILYDETYLGYAGGHPSVTALKAAVMYSAASSMTTSQCRIMFQNSKYCDKDTLLADCRRYCETAIEKSGLLTTRDITVLQAFVLYLAARRSDDQSRAVWTLMALAVRIAKALSLFTEPEKLGRRESFFDQQQRGRLWLTICLMDLQASHHFASQPLISLEEAISSFNAPGHINDSDFGPETIQPVPNREGLTDITYAFVKYKLQLFARLTSFGTHTKTLDGVINDNSSMATSPSQSQLSDREVRQKHAQRFEEEVVQLLHLCDPESSNYAWFVFHSAQCFLSGTKASALRPFQRTKEGNKLPPPRIKGDTELLRLSTKVLEKAVLVHTDPRGEAFRWAVTIPWFLLAICIAECYISTDAELVRNVWPVLEASYQHHEALITQFRGGMLRGPLGKLMRRTREKVSPMLANASLFASSNGAGSLSGGALQVNSVPQQQLNAATESSSSENTYILSSSLFGEGSAPMEDTFDQSWDAIWEEVMSSVSSSENAYF